MRRIALALSGLSLSACSTAYITHEAIASNRAVEAETNSILVTNILRARDGVPTYYSDISHLRGSLREAASLGSSLAVGPYKNWSGRGSLSPGLAVESSPSFDVAPLNTEDFTRGINEPLDVRVFQYYIDRSLSAETLLELFVDKIEDVSFANGVAEVKVYSNTICDDDQMPCSATARSSDRPFDQKIRSWLTPGLRLNAYRLLLPYGPAFSIDNGGNGKQAGLRDYSYATRANNLTLRPMDGDSATGAGGHMFRFYTVSNNIAICVAKPVSDPQHSLRITVHDENGGDSGTSAYQVLRIARNSVGGTAATQSEDVDASACVKREVYSNYETPSASVGAYTVIHFRSVDGMVEFLGRMLRLPPDRRPLRFDISTINEAGSRFSTNYQGKTYYVHDRQGGFAGPVCVERATNKPCLDHTLEILTLVNQLLNLNKKATDLPSTGSVQLVN